MANQSITGSMKKIRPSLTLVNCTGITVKNLTLTNNGEGILLAFTKNSTITQNTITNNGPGIFFYGSSRNNISANYIAYNEGNGISIRGGENNLFGNTIINNSANGVLLYFSNYNTIRGNNIPWHRHLRLSLQ